MQIVQFYINNNQFKEAISKLGSKEQFYGFAKDAFLSKLEEVKELRKEVWYECPACKTEWRQFVKAEVEKGTGRLIPICDCGRGLVRRVQKVVS